MRQSRDRQRGYPVMRSRIEAAALSFFFSFKLKETPLRKSLRRGAGVVGTAGETVGQN